MTRLMNRAPFLFAAAMIATATSARAEEKYDIGPLDILRVSVLGQPEMSGEFPVEADGMMAFPFLGRIKASDMTLPEFEKKLTTLLADGYLKRPQVAVSVKEYRSQRVYVTGEVGRPGPYSLRTDRTLQGLLTDLGPLGVNAGHEVVVTRPPLPAPPPLLFDAAPERSPGDELPLPAAAEEVFRVNLAELQSGKPSSNIELRAGDTVRIPKAANIYVQGFATHPGPLRYEEGLTVFQALNLAGGVSERGAAGRVKLVRLVNGNQVETKPSPNDILQPGDILIVPEKFF
jgi:polysaccharide biosynthesis/export protein